MDTTYVYQKKRSEFGRQCMFSDKGPDLIDSYLPDKSLAKYYILRNPVDRWTQCAPVQAEHYLNTTRAEYHNTGVNHVEGGWPRDVNIADEEQTKRYRRKVEKDENYYTTMMSLMKNMESSVLQNNAINIYQQYFSDVEPVPLVAPSRARTVNVYQDPITMAQTGGSGGGGRSISGPGGRPITHLSWSPDNQTKLAVSHCNLLYQVNLQYTQNTESYIWEVDNPNVPLLTLHPTDPIVCLEYNQKDPNSLVSGQFSGQVAMWDTRKGNEPVELSRMEAGFRDPVHNVLWINSKTGTEFFSCSTDGCVKWWDTRKMSDPTEVLLLDMGKPDEEPSMVNALGASCLEYETTMPTRYMVGTEQGVIISCNRKGKTPAERMMFRFQAHTGPVLALQRNPAFVKNFLSVGDWTARIWSEDCRESSIMWTNYHKALLTDGAWSPTRVSVYFTTRSDGILDCWDVLQQQKHASLSVKVCDEPLKCMRTHDNGRLVAVASQSGTTYLVEFSENLAMANKNDKMLLTAMLERESHREKILEARNREIRLKQRTKSTVDVASAEEVTSVDAAISQQTLSDTIFNDKYVIQCGADFYHLIAQLTGTKDDAAAEEEPVEEASPEEILEETTEATATTVEPEVQPPPLEVADGTKQKTKKKREKGKKGKPKK